MLFFGTVSLFLGVYYAATIPIEQTPSEVNLIKPNTEENIYKIFDLDETDHDHAEELSGQFEGDIVMSEADIMRLQSKTGLVNTAFRWRDNIVPYEIESYYFNDDQVDYIIKATKEIEAVTCIRFVPKNDDHEDFITIQGNDGGCFSSVGRRGGGQILNLAPSARLESGCFRLFTIVHEFIHALGFYHMQSATERDEYVQIIWQNIEPGREHNFNTYDAGRISNFDVEYDPGSVMHYGSRAFSINGEETIVALQGFSGSMGQRREMSSSDIERINRMYNCPEVPEFREIPEETEKEQPSMGFNERMLFAIRRLISGVLSKSEHYKLKKEE